MTWNRGFKVLSPSHRTAVSFLVYRFHLFVLVDSIILYVHNAHLTAAEARLDLGPLLRTSVLLRYMLLFDHILQCMRGLHYIVLPVRNKGSLASLTFIDLCAGQSGRRIYDIRNTAELSAILHRTAAGGDKQIRFDSIRFDKILLGLTVSSISITDRHQ